MKKLTAIAALPLLAAPAFAQVTGDAAAGESVFSQCQSCHVVENEAGEIVAGRNSRTGPNLYGVALRQAGSLDTYDRYSDSMVEAGEQGMVWDEANFVPYVQDPTGHLREVLDSRRARGAMSYRLRDEQEAYDVYAYLVSIGPELTEEQQGFLMDASEMPAGGDS
ncbi:cytochrome c [Hasllibacter halocynthiae]|uniref:Cytochrome c n=1 Tax=Hasllibacter halocynthiae TaxID=595589 RepID=A0A2T0X2U4_9RHOB|nr:c-type cytochrome [Hasllibacter halocynthiae]PRY93251.1 cytochrome c [Hasllibacter halocynthiae]